MFFLIQQSDHISGMNALPYNAFALNPNQSLNPHAQFQRTLPPGSPAKGFSMLGGAQLNQQPLSNTQLYNATVPGKLYVYTIALAACQCY